MDSDNRNDFAIGQLLLGKYRIERVIGQGGMGLVLGATHVELQHRVAIKVLLPNGPGGEKFETRFLREAQAAASLRSENVVRVYDVGRLEDDRPYMVMEWLDGHDLSSGPMGKALPAEQAVDYVIQACDAMAVAHGRNLVHRDLKPANLFLAHDEHGVPIVKVLDFGISKLRRDDEANLALTEANGLIGSPLYMAPEQARSARDVDARADIWSLGTILYELLTAEPPFKGETLGAVFLAVAQDTPCPLTTLRPELPMELEQVVARCLSKDPAGRYPTAQDLQRALLPFASARSQTRISMRSSGVPSVMPPSVIPPSVMPPSMLPSVPRGVAATTPVAQTNGGWSDAALRSRPTRQRRRTLLLGVSCLVLVAAAGGGWAFVRRPAETQGAPVPTATNPGVASPVAAAAAVGQREQPTVLPAEVTDAAALPSGAASLSEPGRHPLLVGKPTDVAAVPHAESKSNASVVPAAKKVIADSRALATVAPSAAPVATPPATPAAATRVTPTNSKKNPLDIQFK